MTFQERMAPVRDEMIRRRFDREFQEMGSYLMVRSNCSYLRSVRKGEYLIKIARNGRFYTGEKNLYIDFSYIDRESGWFTSGKRKDAQWFTGKEAQEFIKNRKGFHIVKK